MKSIFSWPTKLIGEAISTVTSRERLKQLWSIPLYSNAVYLLFSFGISAVLGFVFWIVAARFYSTEEVGLASAAISVMGLVATLANLGLGHGITRFLSRAGESASPMINTAITISTLASIAAALIFIAGLELWSPALLFIREKPVYLVSFVVFTIASTLVTLTGQIFVAERRSSFALAQGLTQNLLKLALGVTLAAYLSSFGIFVSWGIALIAILFLSLLYFMPRIRPGYQTAFLIDKQSLKNIFQYSFGNYIGYIFWSVPALILPVIVVNILGAEPNAFFYIAWSVASIFSNIPNAVSASLFAEGSYDEAKMKVHIWRTLKMVFLILFPLVVLVLIFADKILFAFGRGYSETAASLLRLLTVASIPLAINTVYLDIKRVEKKLKLIMGLTTFIAIATMGLSYFLLPRMGINGVGVAWLASHGVVALVTTFSLVRRREAIQ